MFRFGQYVCFTGRITIGGTENGVGVKMQSVMEAVDEAGSILFSSIMAE